MSFHHHLSTTRWRARRVSLVLATVFAAVALVGCQEAAKPAGSSGSGGASPTSRLNPPKWIHGTWAYRVQGYDSLSLEWTFTSSTAVHRSQSITITYPAAASGGSLSQTATNDRYAIQVRVTASGQTISSSAYLFVRQGDSAINYSVTSNGVTVGPLVLAKQ